MARYKVVELFTSINGEGVLAGQLAVFVRFQGCNLSCSFCDTKWANEADAPFVWMEGREIYQRIRETGIQNVTLTGGEPLLQKEIGSLLSLLAEDSSLRVEVETNGSVLLEPFSRILNRPAFTMDYKLPGSGMEEKMQVCNFDILSNQDTVKFVVKRTDLPRVKEVISQYGLTERCHVYISPVFGEIEPVEIVNFLTDNKLNDVNLQLQLHKIIWDPDKRGV